MDASPPLVDFTEAWEEFRATVYIDIGGHGTIGYGHCLLPGEQCTSLTRPAAVQLLMLDLSRTGSEIQPLITAPCTQRQYDAMLDFAFNLGAGALSGSTLLRLFNSGDATGAAAQFLAWDHVRDPVSGMLVPNAGLEKRRVAEQNIFANGDYSGRP